MSATVTHIHGAERRLTKRELAEILNVSQSWIEKRMAGPDPIPHLKLSPGKGAVRYKLSAVESWLERRAS